MIAFFYNVLHIDVSGFKEGNHFFLPIVIVGSLEHMGLVHSISFFHHFGSFLSSTMLRAQPRGQALIQLKYLKNTKMGVE